MIQVKNFYTEIEKSQIWTVKAWPHDIHVEFTIYEGLWSADAFDDPDDDYDYDDDEPPEGDDPEGRLCVILIIDRTGRMIWDYTNDDCPLEFRNRGDCVRFTSILAHLYDWAEEIFGAKS
jgi:hypothetical protein